MDCRQSPAFGVILATMTAETVGSSGQGELGRDEYTLQPTEPGFYSADDGRLDPADIELKVYGFTTFQVVKPFVYIDSKGEIWPIQPNEGTDTTDLASVPRWLWGLIASYGRQLAPALMHDYYCGVAKAEKAAAKGNRQKIQVAYQDRRATDLRFREALRVRGIPWFRSNVFWGAVTFDRYKSFKWPLAVLYILQAAAVAAGIIGALGLWLWHWAHSHSSSNGAQSHQPSVITHPWLWLIIAGIGLCLSVLYGWNTMLAVASGSLAAPIVVIELVVTALMAVSLFIPDLLITLIGRIFSLGHAKKLHWPLVSRRQLTAKPSQGD
jgi:hypothetical protein